MVALFATAAFTVLAHAGVDLAIRPWSLDDPRLAEHWKIEGRQVLQQRADAARGAPHLISQPGVVWGPTISRRQNWNGSAVWKTRDLRSAVNAGGVPPDPPDTIHVAFIRIDFTADRGGSASTGDGHFNLDPGDTLNNPVDRPPHNRAFYQSHHEALARYYDAESYGRVVITGDVWPRVPDRAYSCSDMADLGPWKFSQDIEAAAVHMFKSFIAAADTQATQTFGDSIPWNSIDHIVFIHAGSDLQSDVRQDSKEDIPSFTLGVSDSNAVILRNPDGSARTRPINRAAFFPETANQDGYYGTLNGVIAHECGHLIFGFIDLYNVQTGFPVVGFWSLMDSGNLVGAIVKTSAGDSIFATGLLPPSVDPFHRFFCTDVLAFPEVGYGLPDTIQHSERHPDMRRLTLSSDEYLLIENRYLSAAPTDSVRLDQDETTRVILGPKTPDRYEYDSLTPGGGVLVWHIDESVIPFNTSLRPNPGYAVNTNRSRLGVSVVEADGLADLGDLGSPFLLGSYRDPFYVGNNTVLSDDTAPNLRPHIGTRPHARFEVLDTLKATMRFRADRAWQRDGWPVETFGQFPPGGPQLLAVDADGDGQLEVCWAGGDTLSDDSTAVFAIRPDGTGLGTNNVIARFDRRPRPVMAALTIGGPRPEQGPALFAAVTYVEPPGGANGGGQLWLVDHTGGVRTGFPVAPAGTKLSTPPVFAGQYPDAWILAGAEDGFVYAYQLDGTLVARSATALAGGVRGRLAVSVRPAGSGWLVAAGGDQGDVGVFEIGLSLDVASGGLGGPLTLTAPPGWPQRVGSHAGFVPDFLWINLDGEGGAAGDLSGCGSSPYELVVHEADRLWGFCAGGRPLPGWGHSLGDSLSPGLGAGDPDGDGLPEVLIQTHNSKLGFINLSGGFSPGWPKPGSFEGALQDDTLLTEEAYIHRFPSLSPPLALDVDGTRRPSVVALNTSGIIVALHDDGKQAQGWPLATGAGTAGAPLAADLDRDGLLDLVAPDRFGRLYGYELPADTSTVLATSWTMLGGDPQRTSWLPSSRTTTAPAVRRGPVVAGSVKAYPNPARRRPVTIAYTLTEPATVEVRVLDTSGHEVASFRRDGRIAENLETWNPGSVPAGLYLVHVSIRGLASETSEVIPVGVLK